MDAGGVVGQYRITGLLGQGGMGAVYAAEHTLIGRPAAVKVLLPEFSRDQEIVTRFFNEARAATAVRHPGIIEIYDFGWHSDGAAYIVMERLEGDSLAARNSRERMSWYRALAIARQIAGVLAAAHSKGIIHRDLKPENVFLDPDPEVSGGERIKLLDFGIAKLVGDTGNQGKTRTGMVMGTPAYMAPEQCRGVAIDHRADLYALGCILFELCTGRPPFLGEGSGDVLAAHIHVQVPTMMSLVHGIPPEVERLVQRLLAKQPQDRVQTAIDVIRDIDAIAGAASLSGSRPISHATFTLAASPNTTLSGSAGVSSTAPRRRGHAPYWGLGGVVVLLAIISTIYVARRGVEQRPSIAPSSAPGPSLSATPEASPNEAPPRSAVSPQPQPQPQPQRTVDVSVDSTPPGAEIVVSGDVLGKTPFRGTLPYGERDLPVVIRLRGYVDGTLLIHPDNAISQHITLVAMPPPEPSRNHDDSVNPFQ